MVRSKVVGLALVLVVGACSSDAGEKPADDDLTKSEAAQRNDGVDYCDLYDWYGDGECDTFCVSPDPDCGAANSQNNANSVNNANGSNSVNNANNVNNVECPDPNDPNVRYVADSNEDPTRCDTINFACDEGEYGFSDRVCGCGCITESARPEFCDSPLLVYVSESPQQCMLIDFGCPEGQQGFDHPECGCGCFVNPPACNSDEDCLEGYCDVIPQVLICQVCPVVPQQVCYPHQCDDGSEVFCDALPPMCPVGAVAVARDGCWACVDARTCEPVMF